MNLNLHILKEDLKQWNFDGTLLCDPIECYCTYPVLCLSIPENAQKELLYIIKAEHLPSNYHFSKKMSSLSIICIGKPQPKWLQNRCNLLYTEDVISETDLINFINQRFYYYKKWGDTLQNLIDQQLPIQDFAVYSTTVIQNPIYAQGSFFQVLCMYLPPAEEETPLYQTYKKDFCRNPNDILSPEDINYLITDQEFNEAIYKLKPTIYSGEHYGFRTLYLNLFIQDTFVARLCFDEIITPFTSKDFALIQILGEYLKKALANVPIYSFNRPKELEEIMDSLLAHRLLPEDRIKTFLQMLQWNYDDSYVCLVIQLKTDYTMSALEPIALQLASIIGEECYIVRDNQIVSICNLDKLNLTGKQLYANILPFLRDNLLSAGISSTYHDFKKSYYYYQQAIIARTIGETLYPTQWYFKFEECQLEYMLQKCTDNTLPEILIPEGLKALLNYDKRKNHNYAEVLRVYLDHDRNIADTIRITYLHRNTFLYQIKRIQEIIKMNLDDPDVRLILQLAFRILDRT